MGVEDATAIRGLLGYKEKTAGGIMTPEVTTVTEDMTVQEVIEHLRDFSGEHESIYYVYVVEGDRHLAGVISLRDLLLSSPETTVETIAVRDLFSVNPDDDQEDVAELMSKYDLLAMPVVDERGRILGIVTVDDALDVLEEESAEDLALATGSSRERGRSASMWWWLVRRSAWLLAWGVIALVTLATLRDAPGGAWSTLLLPTLVFLPLLLRTAEDVSQRAIAEMIEEDDDNRPALWHHLVRDGLAGLALGVVAGGFVFGTLQLITRQPVVAGVFAVVTALSIIVVMVAGVGVTELARRRVEADKPVSGTALGVFMMLLGALVYLAFAVAGGLVLAAIPGAHA
jgi:Mg/Co/Ni transporter MgtE